MLLEGLKKESPGLRTAEIRRRRGEEEDDEDDEAGEENVVVISRAMRTESSGDSE